MSIEILVGDLRRQGVELRSQGKSVRISAPAGVLTPDIRAALSDHRDELMAMLGQQKRYTVMPGWSRRSWIERLRQMAEICMHAERAAELRAWADGLERQSEEAGSQARGPPTIAGGCYGQR